MEIVRRQAEEIERLKARIAELEVTLGQRKDANASKPPKFSGNYSLGQDAVELGDQKRFLSTSQNTLGSQHSEFADSAFGGDSTDLSH